MPKASFVLKTNQIKARKGALNRALSHIWLLYYSTMLIRKAFKFQLQPNGAQQRDMRRYAGNARKVWNLAFAQQQANHATGEKFASAMAMTYWLPAMKETFAFLKDSPSQTLQQVTTDLAFAYKNFFAGRADFPKFKKKGKSGDSFRFPQGFKLEPHNNLVFLPKLGWLRYRNSRDVVGTIKNITVSCTNGQWFASMQTEQEVAQPLPTATTAVGIDVGIARFATLSDGTFIAPVNSFKQHQVKLARYQRSMSRKVKFSKNWQKARQKVSKTHARIANMRRDFLHKTSTIISKKHAMIFVEDLKVANMSKSAKGTAAKPGRKVRQKAGLNRSILDQGWSEFRRQLEYKQAWNGGWLDAVPPQYTSQECPCCGHTAKDNRKTQAHFVCMDCGFAEHADLVGAINIRRAGLARLACGDTSLEVRASAQESTEDTRQLLAA